MIESHSYAMSLLTHALFIGIGATVVMDIWAVLLKVCFDVPSLSYSLVGRWLGHIPQGKFVHKSISNSEPVIGESAIGWTAHYFTGVFFATLLLMIWGVDWALHPTLIPALVMGIATVIFPFLVMQPGMGLGIAAANTPKPNIARLRSILAHAIFGIGFYISAVFCALFTSI